MFELQIFNNCTSCIYLISYATIFLIVKKWKTVGAWNLHHKFILSVSILENIFKILWFVFSWLWFFLLLLFIIDQSISTINKLLAFSSIIFIFFYYNLYFFKYVLYYISLYSYKCYFNSRTVGAEDDCYPGNDGDQSSERAIKTIIPAGGKPELKGERIGGQHHKAPLSWYSSWFSPWLPADTVSLLGSLSPQPLPLSWSRAPPHSEIFCSLEPGVADLRVPRLCNYIVIRHSPVVCSAISIAAVPSWLRAASPRSVAGTVRTASMSPPVQLAIFVLSSSLSDRSSRATSSEWRPPSRRATVGGRRRVSVTYRLSP